MSYTSIRTAHSVGDTVYFYEAVDDCVRRVVVVGIEARSTDLSYAPKWSVMYRCVDKWAAEPRRDPYFILEDNLKKSVHDAFPPIPPELASVEAEEVSA